MNDDQTLDPTVLKALKEAPEDKQFGYKTRIAPELEPLAVDIFSVDPHPDNARKHNIKAIQQSLLTHGQRSVIVVQRSTGYICKGNGTWRAAALLGWDKIAASIQDIDDEMARKYLLDDNRASDLSEYNREKLVATLKKVAPDQPMLWGADEIADLEEELEGALELPEQDTQAEFTGLDGKPLPDKKEKKDKALPGEKMREVPLVLTVADHAEFVTNIKFLQKSYGLSGNIATIMEAVKRAVALEKSGKAITGPAVIPNVPVEGQVPAFEELEVPAAPAPDVEAEAASLADDLLGDPGDLAAQAATIFAEQMDPDTESLGL